MTPTYSQNPYIRWRQIIEDGVLILGGRCDGARSRDGVGFDGADTNFGKSLADQIADRRSRNRNPGDCLSEKQFLVAEKLVTGKYRKQLERAGLVLGPNPETEPVARVQATAPVIPPPTIEQICVICKGAVADVGQTVCLDCAMESWTDPSNRDLRTTVVSSQQIAAHPHRSLRASDYIPNPDGPSDITIQFLLSVLKQKIAGYEDRPAQVRLMELVEDALTGQGDYPDVVAEAGTGIGKSWTFLLSHLAAFAMGREPGIISMPTKALQEQYRKDTAMLQELLADVRPFTVAELKGRRNYLCQRLYRELLDGLEDDTATFRSMEDAAQFTRDVQPWAQATTTGDVEDTKFAWSPTLQADLTTGRDGCAGKDCEYAETCWANKAVKAAGQADIVITNTKLLGLHLRVYAETEGHAGVIPLGIIPREKDDDDWDAPEPEIDLTSKPRIYLDEAHQLEEIMRETLGAEVHMGQVQHVLKRVVRLTSEHKLVKKLRKVLDSKQMALTSDEQVAELARAERVVAIADSWQVMVDATNAAASTAFGIWRKRLKDAEASAMKLGDEDVVAQEFVEALETLRKRIKDAEPPWLETTDAAMWKRAYKQTAKLQKALTDCIAQADADVTVRFMELDKNENTGYESAILKAQPIDIAPTMRAILWETFPNVIALSATLAGPDGLGHWRHRVGAPETEELIVKAPFDYPRQALLYLPTNPKRLDPRGDGRKMNTPRGRDYLEAAVSEMEMLVRAADGGTLLLFSSRRDLDNCYKGVTELHTGQVVLQAVAGLADRLEGDGFTLIRQGQYPRPAIVKMMKAGPANGQRIVVLGLKTFSEGIDIAGEALRCVAVLTFPFTPPDSPVWDAICEAEDRRAEREMAWFNNLAVPAVTIAMKQSTGRLVRTMTDFGTMAILDGRTELPYGKRIVNALPPARRTSDPEAVRAFFARKRRTTTR